MSEIKENRVPIITTVTHSEDIDGAMCAILLGQVDHAEVREINCIGVGEKDQRIFSIMTEWSKSIVTEISESNSLNQHIFMICDLDISMELIEDIHQILYALEKDIVNEFKHKFDDSFKEFLPKVVCVDHHNSSRILSTMNLNNIDIITPDNIDGFETDESKSACAVLLHYITNIFPVISVSKITDNLLSITDSVSRYDTWMWKEHPTENVFGSNYPVEFYFYKMFGILGLNKWIEGFSNILNDPDGNLFPDEYVEKALESYKFIDNFIEKKNSQLVKITIDEYCAGLIVSSHSEGNFSIMANELCERNKDIDMLIALFPESRSISARSIKNDLNLARFAKGISENGKGGGHPKAAGATISADKFFKLLNAYWIGKEEKDNNVNK